MNEYNHILDLVIEDERLSLSSTNNEDYFVYRIINSRFGVLYIVFNLLRAAHCMVMRRYRIKKLRKEYSAK